MLQGIRIIVYTRFDCEEFRPIAAARTLGQCDGQPCESSESGPLVLELYAITGKAVYGREYDPVFPWK